MEKRVQEFDVTLSDASSADAYPITAASFVLIHRYPKDEKRNEVLAFFRWTLENGQDMAASLDDLPLSSSLVQEVLSYWKTNWDPPPAVACSAVEETHGFRFEAPACLATKPARRAMSSTSTRRVVCIAITNATSTLLAIAMIAAEFGTARAGCQIGGERVDAGRDH